MDEFFLTKEYKSTKKQKNPMTEMMKNQKENLTVVMNITIFAMEPPPRRGKSLLYQCSRGKFFYEVRRLIWTQV